MLPTPEQLLDLVILLLAALLQVLFHWTRDYLQLQRVRLSQPPISTAEPSRTADSIPLLPLNNGHPPVAPDPASGLTPRKV